MNNLKPWLAAILSLTVSGCMTDPYGGGPTLGNTGKGAAIGAAAGAGAGTLFGGNDWKNAGWGALAGGAVGAAVGYYMDRQEQQMRQSLKGTGIAVQRTADSTLNLTLPSNVTFAFDSAELTQNAQHSLNTVAGILNQFPDSHIVVTGHTDDLGPEQYNLGLSQRRAASVAGYLIQSGVTAERIQRQGLGESAPKVANNSEANRAQNRRVELTVIANANAGADGLQRPRPGYPGQNAPYFPPPGQPNQTPPYPQAPQGYPPAGGYR